MMTDARTRRRGDAGISKGMNKICHICEKPIGRFEIPFLHMIKHIQEGIAVGKFDKKGRWWFRKVENQEGGR